jgi:hypothetical protein
MSIRAATLILGPGIAQTISRGTSMKREQLTGDEHLGGFITERDFDLAEEAFPGIAAFYEGCLIRPGTFLELVWQFANAPLARPPAARLPPVCGSYGPGLTVQRVDVTEP